MFDPDNKMIFASHVEGTVSVIRQKSANEYKSIGSIQTQRSAKTMAFDPNTKRLFLSAAETEPAGKVATVPMPPKPGTFGVLVIER